uniref:E3 ubiquitin-protein ligase ubr3 n=1 Tax=Sphaerodactylus townsendi TaxID=933632 RepID=A0ACB8G1N0_9SAUR
MAYFPLNKIKTNISNAKTSHEALLSHVISELSKGKVYNQDETEDLSMDNNSAWCLHSPETYLQQFCLPFLRITSLLQHHLFGGELPSCQESKWDLPRLLQLPENYNTIFQYYHRKSCSVCTKVPKDPAVCLVCGTFVCLKGLCCKQQSYCECVLHSQNCGAGTGIFLLINASVIIIIRGHRFCLWGSVYLDAHGEEDRDLRRGKPLYICKERYKVLEQQWISHTFDHINKRWGPHYNERDKIQAPAFYFLNNQLPALVAESEIMDYMRSI